ncbi:MAG: hypothetical protein J6Y19_05820 [Kiritimatiellae bacterium]|nr:hypothetical protein [Kiritimatiellia bacterium]
MKKNEKHAGKTVCAIMAGAMVAASSGCVVIPCDGAKVYKTPTVTTKTVGTEGEMGFHPDVKRSGNVVRLRMVADGMFVEETTRIRRCKVQAQRLAVGLFPGFADDPDAVIPALIFLGTYNAVLLGFPTLSGLMVEPFLPARQSGKISMGDFRRMALVGCSRYSQGEKEAVEPPEITRRSVHKTQSVGEISFWFDAEPKFWGTSAQDGDTLVLRGVEAGRHTGKLYIKSVPVGHFYEKELKRMEWVAIDVDIPE